MIIIGITGSIGTGKTTVSKMLKILKIPIFDSDKKVREILDENQIVIEKILQIWPDTVSSNLIQKKIDKVVLSNKIFNNKKERKKLEDIIHPLIEKERKTFLQNFENFNIVGLDVPLLYETGKDKECDYVFLMKTSKKNSKRKSLKKTKHDRKKI